MREIEITDMLKIKVENNRNTVGVSEPKRPLIVHISNGIN